jgi:hypothetical protein
VDERLRALGTEEGLVFACRFTGETHLGDEEPADVGELRQAQ